jgi:hypothetical protein
MKESSPQLQSAQQKRVAALLAISQLGYAHWLFGNLYEAVVRVPERLANDYEPGKDDRRLPSVLSPEGRNTMSFRTIATVAIISLSTWQAASAQSGKETNTPLSGGKLGGRQGSFVLQGSEIVENGKIKAKWFVVPGSGTGDLSGLRGEGGFEGEFGKGSEGTLDYWFE